jgi:hypothetical protein
MGLDVPGWCRFVAVSALLIAPTSAAAVCPDTPAECLGDAAAFRLVVAESARLGTSRLHEGNNAFYAWTYIEGDVCAETVSALSPPPGAFGTTEVQDVAVLATSGVGVRAKTMGSLIAGSPGLETGTIATAGAAVGPFVDATSVDTSGTHPLVEACARAQADSLAAVAQIASLPATGNLGEVVLAAYEEREITLPPGVNVLDADRIVVGYAAHLRIGGGDWTIIRTPSFRTMKFGDIAANRVLFVLSGQRPAVSVGAYSDMFGVGLLAPERTVRLGGEALVEGIWARKAILRGIDMFSIGDPFP